MGSWRQRHDPGILRTRVRKLRKVAQHATSKRALEAPKGCKRYNLCWVTKSPLLSSVDIKTMLTPAMLSLSRERVNGHFKAGDIGETV